MPRTPENFLCGEAGKAKVERQLKEIRFSTVRAGRRVGFPSGRKLDREMLRIAALRQHNKPDFISQNPTAVLVPGVARFTCSRALLGFRDERKFIPAYLSIQEGSFRSKK